MLQGESNFSEVTEYCGLIILVTVFGIYMQSFIVHCRP